jgi:glycosyltransferase involved in cell wall biosynthesis
MKSLVVEGWRGINTSFAMVNQHQLLQLRRHPLQLFHIDTPFFDVNWNVERNAAGFSAAKSRTIADIPAPNGDDWPEVTYRIDFPYRLDAAKSKRLFVFGTSEYQYIDEQLAEGHLRLGLSNPDLRFVTCSNWSAEGFLRAGFDPSRVLVIPLGIDPEIFRPVLPASKAAIRAALGVNEGEFAILSVGAMTENKGIHWLVFSFALLRRKFPHVRLILKDQANLYNIRAKDVVARLKTQQPQLVDDALESSIIYISQNLTVDQLSALYGAVDCYASPYTAEGFNLTPLEAAACGTPIVITRGGATDDYAHETFALQIDSTKRSHERSTWLEPHIDSMVHELTKLVEGTANHIDQARALDFIRREFSWSSVVNKLVKAMFP